MCEYSQSAYILPRVSILLVAKYNNPFLVDVEEDEFGEGQQQQQQVVIPRHQQRCHLLDFWPNNLVLWFPGPSLISRWQASFFS